MKLWTPPIRRPANDGEYFIVATKRRIEKLDFGCVEKRSRMPVGFVGVVRKVTDCDGVAMWNERIEATNVQRSVYNNVM